AHRSYRASCNLCDELLPVLCVAKAGKDSTPLLSAGGFRREVNKAPEYSRSTWSRVPRVVFPHRNVGPATETSQAPCPPIGPTRPRQVCHWSAQTAGAYFRRGFVIIVGSSCGSRFSWAQVRANSLSSAAFSKPS